MRNKAIVHIMSKSRINSEAFEADIDAMEDLSERYGVKNVIFYKGEELAYMNLISKLEKFGIYTKNYSNKEELKAKVQEFSDEYEVIFVYTAVELLIKIASEVTEYLWLSISDNPDIFRNKFLQREAIQKHNPELGIKFVKAEFQDLDIDFIEKNIGYPCIIKPVDGVQSSGVQKIAGKKSFKEYKEHYQELHDRMKARWVDNKELIVEEFIDGEMYSIDYFVNENQEIILSKPVKVLLASDIGVKDYANLARISTKQWEMDLKGKRIRTFINSTVVACGIRNTFVHHEFKLNSEGKLKTIELNGRFWWGRVDIIRRAYNMNVFEMLINQDIRPGKLKMQNVVFNIYATKKGILQAFNNKLLARIKRRESVTEIRLLENFLGKEVGLTKDGFVKMGTIRLEHKDFEVVQKDFKYIKSKYKHLLVLDDEDTLMHRLKGYLS